MNAQELRFAALRETGIVAHDEVPSAEMDTFTSERYVSLHGQLMEDGIATWAVGEDIPSAVQQAMTWALAFVIAGPLGADNEAVQRLSALGGYGQREPSLAERMLRRYAADKYVPQPATSEYF